MNRTEKPPLGIIPRHLHIEKRIDEIKFAIERYIAQKIPIPIEWFEEYNELVIKYRQIKFNVRYEWKWGEIDYKQ